MLKEAEQTTEDLRSQVIFSREFLRDVKIGDKQVSTEQNMPALVYTPGLRLQHLMCD